MRVTVIDGTMVSGIAAKNENGTNITNTTITTVTGKTGTTIVTKTMIAVKRSVRSQSKEASDYGTGLD